MTPPHPDLESLTAAAERIELALGSGAILGTWVWDVQQNRVTGDDRFARTFGLPPEACHSGLPLETATASIHPDDRPHVDASIIEILSTGGRFSAEYRVRQMDGTYRWVEASGRCDLDKTGQPVRFPGVLVDIDDRKRTEDRLRKSEAEAREATRILQAVLEAVPALIYVKDRDGRMQIANGATLALIGKTWPEVDRRTDVEFLDDGDQAAGIMATDRRLMETAGSEELEEIVGHDHQGPRTFLSQKRAFLDESGNVIGLVGTSVDITGRKRAEEQRHILLRELNHRVKNLFAIACGMVNMTARNTNDTGEMAEALTGRLLALARAHELIHPAMADEIQGENVALADLIATILAPHFENQANIALSGPPLSMLPGAATAMALILHELATNAAKYGALSATDGTLQVAWRLQAEMLVLTWLELGGPAIASPPARTGFGSELARLSANAQLGGQIKFDWKPTGVSIELRARLDLLQPPERVLELA